MGAYDTPSEKCPYCGNECEADWVDVGVGMVRCGPYHCRECGASEIGPEQEKWWGRVDGKFAWKEGCPYTEQERKTGWYEPESKKVSPYANTVGGVLVDHQTAIIAYRMGLLDDKQI